MKKNPQISIVIPVYNVDKYINRCIDSILKQTYKDYEIILIDDGSKDNSLKKIKSYEKKYDFIKVLSQKNSGPAITRNRGIDLASGKYIMFIDSDDYIDKDFLENYINNIEDNDIVIGGFRKVDDKKVTFKRRLVDTEFSKYIVTGPVCHLYKKDLIVNNNIKFLDTNMSEDTYFNVKIYELNPKIKSISYIGYNYYTNPNSISNTKHKGFSKDIDFLGFIKELQSKKIKNKELHNYFLIRYVIWYLLYSGKVSSSKVFLKYYKEYFDWLKKNIPNFKKNKNIRLFGPKGEDKSVGFIIWFFMLMHKIKLIKLFSKVYCRGK